MAPQKVPIETIHLFPLLEEKFIALLRSLSPEDWEKPTPAPLWCVKDIAAHLLDGNFRAISMIEDGYFGDPPGPLNSYEDLVDYLNTLNADWVKAMKRVSPGMLTDLLENTGQHYIACMQRLASDPFAPALFPVSWAGELESMSWFHVAREFTEKWHHQQQIREAVNKPGIMGREFFFPVMDTFMRALPHTYRNVEAAEGTTVHVVIGDDTWNMVKTDTAWKLSVEKNSPATVITLTPDTSWKLFTKAMKKAEAMERSEITGDATLGAPLFSMLSVMA